MVKTFLYAAAAAIGVVYAGRTSQEDLDLMRAATWLNEEEVAAAVGFTPLEQTPYPDGPYNVDISPDENCWLVFEDAEKTTYSLVSAVSAPAGEFGVFLSHETPCGVCSNLQDLATYIATPDLTNPVRSCGLKFSPQEQFECIKEIGFSDKCATIWFHNTGFTRSECLVLCLLNIFSDNNQPFGFVNPCNPNKCDKTINGGPACSDFQFQNGEFRLNPCLQCDECNSGPLFQKIAGRTRRASGIDSGIKRPDLPEIDHNYFTGLRC